MKINKKLEKTLKAWVLRFLIGPSSIIDGAVTTLTLGFVYSELKLTVSRELAKERLNYIMKG